MAAYSQLEEPAYLMHNEALHASCHLLRGSLERAVNRKIVISGRKSQTFWDKEAWQLQLAAQFAISLLHTIP